MTIHITLISRSLYLYKRQLRERSKGSEGSTFTSYIEFDAITKYFQTSSDNENFDIVRHQCT